MMFGGGAWGRIAQTMCCLAMAVVPAFAQKQIPPASAQTTRGVLTEKARALEARGRPDMALQLWEQILLSDPNSADALAGEARDYKLTGNTDKSTEALIRLRNVNPNDPNIARIESMSNQPQSEQLKQAGVLAQQNKPEDAMRIFRQLYGDRPPNGDVALVYYQTLYATKAGKDAAVAGMRDLAAKNPGVSHYAVALGTMLTYDARTRTEGIRILQSHPQDPDAQGALRQAYVWNAANPATASQLRDYLRTHPQDQEVAGLLKQAEAKLAQMNTGIAHTPAEKAAFAALNANRLDQAETAFASLLEKEPKNGRLQAGMGFLRMRQQNFGAAISYLSQAETNGYRERSVQDALSNSRFWFAMGEATQAFNNNQLDLAQSKFLEALGMNPQSPDALSGLAGLLIRQQQYTQAANTYEQLLRVRPNDDGAWRGLFASYARAGQNDKALATIARFPVPVKTAAISDIDFLRTLAGTYQALGNSAEAQRLLVEALALPVAGNRASLQLDTRLQYAGLLLQGKRYSDAAAQYTQVLNLNPSNLGAWEGLISAHHQLGQDTQAVEDVKHMPTAVYESALADPAFLAQLGAIYQQANQFEVAQGLLERAERESTAAGNRPTVDLQLQLAAIYLLRNDPARAYAIYQQLLAVNADNVQAWQGLVTSLHTTSHDSEALQQIALIPAGVRKQLDANIDFVQIEAAVYAGVGDPARAMQYIKFVKNYYARLNQSTPPDVDVENAWLLYNTGDDRSLYDALMRIGGRMDLSVAQREMVQNIWANWSVRRASAAMDNGDYRRAVDILDAARLAFPGNLTVSKAVAGGYVQVGRAKEALAIFKTIPMQNANSGDFQGAVGAALAANDKAQAELWLRQALERFPRDSAILTLAAQYEQSRGDNERAADYYRASLAAMPAVTPADRLAHILVNPEQDTTARKVITAADLQRLLNPDNEPFAKTTKLPPLPAYGPDPYDGKAPVVPLQAAPALNTPASQQTDPTKNTKPLIVPIPSGALNAPALFDAPVPISSGGTGAAQLGAPTVSPQQTAPIAARSLAAETWKGLISALVAGERNAEALQELNKVPADVRSELERDMEFAQMVATLYVTLGDMRRAQPYLANLDNYFFQHADNAPGGLAIQRAWLLYRLKEDAALYGALLHLDQRDDLTPLQQADARKLWATWAVRRANEAMNGGNVLYGVEILQAATQDFPEDAGLRRAVAGAYARVGRAADATALYKAVSMATATPEDFESAISAALATGDMAQSEAWLRQALAGFPHDAQILSLAARFEQARGNEERATEFLRIAITATRQVPTMKPLQGVLAFPPDGYRAPGPGVSRYLLNPGLDQARVPTYQSQTSIQTQSSVSVSDVSPQPARWLTQPSKNPLPLPVGVVSSTPAYTTSNGQGTAPSISLPPPPNSENNSSDVERFSGRVVLPPSEENIATVSEEASASAETLNTTLPLVRPALPAGAASPGSNLRLPSQPMSAAVAETQSGAAGESTGQNSQGSAATIHSLPNSPVQPLQADPGSGPIQFQGTQYTPSAQEATTGAYSAPKQSSAAPATQQEAQHTQPLRSTVTPQPQAPSVSKSRSGPTAGTHRRTPSSPNSADSTSIAQNPQSQASPPQLPQQQNPSVAQSAPQPSAPSTALSSEQNPPASSGNGLTDQELEDRNLPPLRGPWIRTQRQAPKLNPREVAEKQLQQIESSYSGWMGGTTNVAYRSGALGFARLTALEDPFELSLGMGYHARFTVVAKPVFLDAGQADGSAIISVRQTTAAGTKLVPIPEPIGTLTSTDTTPPAQQNSMGIGGEMQFAFPNVAVAAGYSPYGFLVSTFTARMMWKPANGPFVFSASRDSVKDSQLSYAGLRDPAVGAIGAKWGGVVANQASAQFARGDAQSGYYFALGGQYLTGSNVRHNTRIDGTGGAYWRAFTAPEYGTLTIGGNFFAMHYGNNQNAFTYGMGGYFSPQIYILANAPFTWQGHYETHWHYSVTGAIGAQAFQQSATPLWPLFAQKALQAVNGNPMLPDLTSISGNYDLRSQVAYQIGPHWFAGSYFQANNTRDYNFASIGFFVRYLFREQPSTVTAPTGLFPTDGLRPFTVP